MAKYIDIESINWWDDLFMKGKNDSGVWVRYRDVENLIRNAPAADVVEVVRCIDCVNWNGNTCINMGGLFSPRPNDYCSRGERGRDRA